MREEHHYGALQQQQYGSYLKQANRRGRLSETHRKGSRWGNTVCNDRYRKDSEIEEDAPTLEMLEGREPALVEALCNSFAFRLAWEDVSLHKETPEERQERYQLKHKQGIGKPDRHQVNLASYADLLQLLRAFIQCGAKQLKDLEDDAEQGDDGKQREKLSAGELCEARASLELIRRVVNATDEGTEHSSSAKEGGELDEGGSVTGDALLGNNLPSDGVLPDSDMVPLLSTGVQDRRKANRIKVLELIEILPDIRRVGRALGPQFVVPDDLGQRYMAAAKAISTYRTPSDYVLTVVAMSIANLGGVTCGLLTGTLFYLFIAPLVPAVAPLAILLGSVVGFSGYSANCNYFSDTTLKFLQKLFKQGGLSGYINKDGRRDKISIPTRFFLGFAALLSLSVGIATAAFSLMGLQHILVALALTAPIGLPLSTAIMGVLDVGICVAMTIIIFFEFVKAAPKLSLSYAKERLKALVSVKHSPGEILSCVIKSLFVLFVLFGLYILVFSGLSTLAGGITAVMASAGASTALSTSIGTGMAWGICVASFSAQLLFVSRTTGVFFDFMVSKIKCGVNRLRGRHASNASALLQERSAQCASHHSLTLSERIRHSAVVLACREAFGFIAIGLNAAGNAALVIQMNVLYVVAAVACFWMSAASNLLVSSDPLSQEKRAKLDQDTIQLLQEKPATDGNAQEEAKTQPEIQIPERLATTPKGPSFSSAGSEGQWHSLQPGSSCLFRTSGTVKITASASSPSIGLRQRVVPLDSRGSLRAHL